MFCEINEYGDILIATKKSHLSIEYYREFLWQFYILIAKNVSAYFM